MLVLHVGCLLLLMVTSGESTFFDLTLTSFTLSNLWKKTFSTTTTTITSTISETTVVASQVTRYCATTSAVTGQCRRKRAVSSDILHDSDVPDSEITDSDALDDGDVSLMLSSAVPDTQESVVQLSSSLRDTTTDGDDDVSYQKVLRTDPEARGYAWSYSKYFLTTVTTTTSSTTTTTSTLSVTVATRTYTIIFCTPSTYSLLSC